MGFGDIAQGLLTGINQGVQKRQANKEGELDRMLKMAQLAESGYNIKPKSGGLFGIGGGYELERDPNSVSYKDLQKQELLAKIAERQAEEDRWNSFEPSGDVVQVGPRKYVKKGSDTSINIGAGLENYLDDYLNPEKETQEDKELADIKAQNEQLMKILEENRRKRGIVQ